MLTTGMLNQQMLALGIVALMHSDLFEMLGLMVLVGTCVTRYLTQIEHTM